LCHWNFSFT